MHATTLRSLFSNLLERVNVDSVSPPAALDSRALFMRYAPHA